MTIESMLPAVMPKNRPRRAQRPERVGAVPVRLRDDAHAQAHGLQHPADERHAEAGVVHIGIAGDQHDVAGVPAQRRHLGARHGQEGAGASGGAAGARRRGAGWRGE